MTPLTKNDLDTLLKHRVHRNYKTLLKALKRMESCQFIRHDSFKDKETQYTIMDLFYLRNVRNHLPTLVVCTTSEQSIHYFRHLQKMFTHKFALLKDYKDFSMPTPDTTLVTDTHHLMNYLSMTVLHKDLPILAYHCMIQDMVYTISSKNEYSPYIKITKTFGIPTWNSINTLHFLGYSLALFKQYRTMTELLENIDGILKGNAYQELIIAQYYAVYLVSNSLVTLTSHYVQFELPPCSLNLDLVVATLCALLRETYLIYKNSTLCLCSTTLISRFQHICGMTNTDLPNTIASLYKWQSVPLSTTEDESSFNGKVLCGVNIISARLKSLTDSAGKMKMPLYFLVNSMESRQAEQAKQAVSSAYPQIKMTSSVDAVQFQNGIADHEPCTLEMPKMAIMTYSNYIQHANLQADAHALLTLLELPNISFNQYKVFSENQHNILLVDLRNDEMLRKNPELQSELLKAGSQPYKWKDCHTLIHLQKEENSEKQSRLLKNMILEQAYLLAVNSHDKQYNLQALLNNLSISKTHYSYIKSTTRQLNQQVFDLLESSIERNDINEM